MGSGRDAGKADIELLREKRGEAVIKIVEFFDGAIVRRTHSSWDFDMRPISDREECTVVDFPLKMSEEEKRMFKTVEQCTLDQM